MSDRTAPEPDFEILEGRQPVEPGVPDDDAVCEDQAIHLLLTAWTLVLEEEQQRRSTRRPGQETPFLRGGYDER